MSRHVALNIYPADALLGGTTTLVGGASANYTLDLDDFANLQFIVEVTYSATSSTTGIKLDMYPGIGSRDPLMSQNQQVPMMVGISSTVLFADNPESVVMVGFTPSAAVSQTRRTNFYLNDIGKSWPRFINMRLFNQDPTRTATIRIIADG